MTAWVDLTTENDPSKYRNVSLFSKLAQRDEASITNSFHVPILEVSRTATSYATVATRRVFIPSGAKKFALTFQARAAGGNGLVRAYLKLTFAFCPVVTITSVYPTWAYYELFFNPLLTSLILSTGQSVDLGIQLSHTTGGGTTYFRTDISSVSGASLSSVTSCARFYR